MIRDVATPETGDALQPARAWDAWLVGCLCLGAVLRVMASLNDLWLDEIWTLWMIGQEVNAWPDLVRGAMRHDNNHLLNSAWMHVLGPHRPSLYYRLPSIMAGVVAIAISWALGRQRSHAAARFSAAAFAISYLLVNCQSEARGYGVLSACVLAGQWAVQAGFFRGHRPVAWFPIAAFNAACLLGFAAHATFAFWYLAALPWTTAKIAVGRESALRKLAALALWHALPCAAMALLYFGFLRGMTVGGGPEASLLATVCQTLSLVAGGPLGLPGTAIVAGCVVTVAALCLAQAARRAADEAALFLLAIVLVPAVVLGLFPLDCYAPRHLVVPSITLMVLVGREFPELFTRITRVPAAKILRSGMAALVVAAAAGNLARDAVLIVRGRGAYAATLDWMRSVSADPRGVITCYSNHEFRNRLLVAYHSAAIPGGRYQLYNADSLPRQGAEWYILFDPRHGGVGKERIADRHGNPYRVVRAVRSGGLSPSHWHVYRRESMP
jgi:hypothetical protein